MYVYTKKAIIINLVSDNNVSEGLYQRVVKLKLKGCGLSRELNGKLYIARIPGFYKLGRCKPSVTEIYVTANKQTNKQKKNQKTTSISLSNYTYTYMAKHGKYICAAIVPSSLD